MATRKIGFFAFSTLMLTFLFFKDSWAGWKDDEEKRGRNRRMAQEDQTPGFELHIWSQKEVGGPISPFLAAYPDENSFNKKQNEFLTLGKLYYEELMTGDLKKEFDKHLRMERDIKMAQEEMAKLSVELKTLGGVASEPSKNDPNENLSILKVDLIYHENWVDVILSLDKRSTDDDRVTGEILWGKGNIRSLKPEAGIASYRLSLQEPLPEILPGHSEYETKIYKAFFINGHEGAFFLYTMVLDTPNIDDRKSLVEYLVRNPFIFNHSTRDFDHFRTADVGGQPGFSDEQQQQLKVAFARKSDGESIKEEHRLDLLYKELLRGRDSPVKQPEEILADATKHFKALVEPSKKHYEDLKKIVEGRKRQVVVLKANRANGIDFIKNLRGSGVQQSYRPEATTNAPPLELIPSPQAR